MSVEIITKEDLEIFRMQLLDDFKILLSQIKPQVNEHVEGYKTRHVRQILGCSTNKLTALRIAGKIRCKKIGGTVYYKKEDVNRLVDEGY